MDKNQFVDFAKEIYKLTLLFPKREPLRAKMREIADDMLAAFVMEENDYAGDLRRLLEVMDGYLRIAAEQNWVARQLTEKINFQCEQIGRGLAEIKRPQEAAAEAVYPDFVLVPDRAKDQEKVAEPEIDFVEPRDLMETGAPVLPAIPAEAPFVLPAVAVEALRQEKEEIDEGEGEEELVLSPGQIARQNRIMEFLKERGSAQVWEIQKIYPNVSKRTLRRDFRSMLRQGLIERTGERNTTAYKIKVNLA